VDGAGSTGDGTGRSPAGVAGTEARADGGAYGVTAPDMATGLRRGQVIPGLVDLAR
jgi:hypothetical protein